MPPATIMTSFPAASSSGQGLPKGPRIPTISPRLELAHGPRDDTNARVV